MTITSAISGGALEIGADWNGAVYVFKNTTDNTQESTTLVKANGQNGQHIIQIGTDKNVFGTGTLTHGDSGTTNVTALTSDGTAARTITNKYVVVGNVTLGDATNNGKLTFTHADGLELAGDRKLTVNSDVEFTGRSAINGGSNNHLYGGGTLTLSGGGSMASGALLRVRGGTLSLGGTWDSFVAFVDGDRSDGSMAGKTGTINILAGADVTQTESTVWIGQNTSNYTGEIVIEGTYRLSKTNARLGIANAVTNVVTTGILRINDGGALIITDGTLSLATANATKAELHLNTGGLLETSKAVGSAHNSVGQVDIYLNGGEVKTTADITGTTGIFNAGSSGGKYNVYVQNGGAVFNTNGKNVTVANALKEDAGSAGGGLTKKGEGTLTLTADNAYKGKTVIEAGTLALGASGKIASSAEISIASGATFDVSAVTGGFTLAGTQTLSGNGAVTGNIKLAAGAHLLFSVNDSLAVSGTITLDGDVFLTLSGSGFEVGETYSFFGMGNAIAAADYEIKLTDGYEGTWNYDTGALTITAIPEPSTYALLGAGVLAGLALLRRRKRG